MEQLFLLLMALLAYVVFVAAFLGTFFAVTFSVKYAIASQDAEKKELRTPVVIACLSLSLFLTAVFAAAVWTTFAEL